MSESQVSLNVTLKRGPGNAVSIYTDGNLMGVYSGAYRAVEVLAREIARRFFEVDAPGD